MKCLSLKQPYAELIVSGKKTIELRRWNTKFRGEFLIHASKKVNNVACRKNKIDPDSITRGAIVGKGLLYDVIFYDNRRLFVQDANKHLAGNNYSDCKYGFLIKNAKRFRTPFSINGKLGFFNVDYEE
jgi:hypothetical protein